MPVSLPGFNSYNEFFDLFLPLKKEQQNDFSHPQPITLDDSCFSSKEPPEKVVPFTEDCRRAVQNMICQYADFNQKQFILRILLQGFPTLPVELINAAYSLWHAITRKENIDIAVLNTLGLTTNYLLPEGNEISQLAQYVRETIISWVGESFISQFLNIDENNPDGALFTALAIMAITLKYWMSTPLTPHRRLLQLPPYLAHLVLRISNYWGQIGMISQHAATHCQLPAARAGKDYVCIQENIDSHKPKGLVLLDRDAWTCNEVSGAVERSWKPLATCGFDLSAATLKQVREEGVVGSRSAFSPGNDKFFSLNAEKHAPQPASSGYGVKSSAAALALPIVASLGWRGAGKAALGTSIAAFMGYAWYSMFSRPIAQDITQEQADFTGILTDNERIFLENWDLHPQQQVSESYSPVPPPVPFSESERQQLKQIALGEPGEEAITAAFPVFSTRRAKREAEFVPLRHASLPRQSYWSRREQQAADNSAEKPLLALLKAGPQPGGNYSLAVPRESFPFADPWFTRMDQLRMEEFSAAFQTRLLTTSRNIAHDLSLLPPDTGLPVKTWLHLGKYYERFYKRVVQGWAKAILSMDTGQSEEYAFAARNIGSLVKRLNSDWNGKAINPSTLKELTSQSEALNERHAQLEVFRTNEKTRIAATLSNYTQGFSREISINEFSWDDDRVAYLENIDLSKFTPEYKSIIKGFVESNIVVWSNGTGRVDLIDFYTGMSMLTLSRVYDGLKSQDIKKIYNYALLDEQLTRIIKEYISGLWLDTDQDKYFEDYNPIVYELLPRWWETKAQLPHTLAWKAPVTPAPVENAPPDAVEQSFGKTFALVNWDNIREAAETSGQLPPERFNAEKYIQQKIKVALDEAIEKMIYIAKKDVLNPELFIESWIDNSLKIYGQGDKYNSSSLFEVDFPRHPDEEIKTMDGYGGQNKPPRVYNLGQLVRGVHREYDREHKTKSFISWPENFSAQLCHHLETGISNDIDKHIESLFTDDKQSLRDVYQIMIRRSALNYLMKKNAVPSADLYHGIFANTIAMYLKGKIEAQMVFWHGSPVSGLIFIPAKKAVHGGLKSMNVGVFLSVWSDDYYEVPWPGLAPSYPAGKHNVLTRQKLTIESKEDFRDFMNRHKTIRTGRSLARINDAFGFEEDFAYQAFLSTQMLYTRGYLSPFTFTSMSAKALTDGLIHLAREDIQDLYDSAIFSDAELDRAIIHERLNALAIISGVLLMGATLAFGGPAWTWVLASMATSLFLDVVPHAILYSQADSDDEREVYMQSMVMAVTFEVGGNIVSEAAGPVIRAAVSRLSRLSSTAFRNTLPQWYQFTKTKLENTLTKNGARSLKRPAIDTPPLSPAAKHDLEQLTRKFDPPAGHGNNGIGNPIPGGSGASSGYGIGPGSDFLQQQDRLYDISHQLNLLRFRTRYRVITEWEDTKYYFIRNFYTLFGERDGDRVVLKILTHGKDYSYIFIAEDEWLRHTIKEANQKNVLITYYDFHLPNDIAIKHRALSQYSSIMLPADYPKKGHHVYVPPAWQEKITLFKFKYEEMQTMLDKVVGEEADSLSKNIRTEIENNPALQNELNKKPRLPEPPLLRTENEASNKAMLRCHYLCELGTDIENFYPLPKWLPLMDATDDYVKKWNTLVIEHIEKSKDLKLVKKNFIALKEAGGAGIVTAAQVAKLENEFLKLYSITEKLAALLLKAKNDPLLRENILATLARFVNSTNPRILGEAYQRLDSLAERLYQIAHYHVMEQRLARVVPMTPFSSSPLQAFVIAQDPYARLMIILPKLAEDVDIAGILTHEMSHLAIHTDDFRYLNKKSTGYGKLPEHHVEFGQYALDKNSPYAALGQSQQFYEAWKPPAFNPLTEFDRALAQARVRAFPMLGAYVKMNNADSLVILINALIEQFDFSQNGQAVKGVIDENAWSISLASERNRKKRSLNMDEDHIYHQFREDLLVLLFYQVLSFTKADILPDDE